MLVAIAIPIFTSQLEKSREATDLANIRAAYAEASTKVLDTEEDVTSDAVPLKQAVDGWVTTNHECAGITLSDDIAKKGKSVKVTVHADGSDPTFAVE